MNYSLAGSSVHGILQARTLEWVAMSSSRGSSRPRDPTHVSYISCTGRQVLYHWRHPGSPYRVSPLIKIFDGFPSAWWHTRQFLRTHTPTLKKEKTALVSRRPTCSPELNSLGCGAEETQSTDVRTQVSVRRRARPSEAPLTCAPFSPHGPHELTGPLLAVKRL